MNGASRPGVASEASVVPRSILDEAGRVAVDDHLWIAETAIRHWVSDRAAENCDQGSWGMVDYARSKGWTDEAGTHLRAHIDRVD